MQKALLIAEKPSFMRDIEMSYNHIKSKLPYEIDFVAQVGHLVELLDPAEINPIYKSWDANLLPINPGKEDGWQYKVKPETKDIYEKIEKAVKSGKYDLIIHAGDADQEGELLVRLVLQKIGNKLPVLRFWTNDTTPSGLEAALQNLKPDSDTFYQNLYHAALIRMHTDWLFGINGSRAVADRIYVRIKLAVGRVMTWVQTAVVDRENEIVNFVPKTSYGVKVFYDNGLGGSLYIKPVETTEREKESAGIIYFDTKKEAEDVIRNLSNKGTVIKCDKKQSITYAPKLYKLTTIQIEASKLGFTASETLSIIQSLYEKHYVSYPRTECEVLSSNEDFRAIIASAACIKEYEDAANLALKEIPRVMGIKKYVDDKELQNHGHSALVPTNVKPDFSTLHIKEQTIYKLIARRFLAIFQPPLIQEKTTVLTRIDDKEFYSSGKKILDKGYTDFMHEKIQDSVIPDVNEGDVLNVVNSAISEKTTTCPKRFTSGTLIALMENPSKYLTDKTIKETIKNLSIGTPATRSGIIDKLIKDKYIVSKKGVLYPTDFGAFMINTIRGVSLCHIDTTGQWEQVLMKVRTGEVALNQAEQYMEKQLDDLLKDIKGVNKVSYGGEEIEPIMACPGCGKYIMESPRNYYCMGYKDGCKYSLIKSYMGAHFTRNDAKELFSGNAVVKVLTKADKSKTWKQKIKFNADEGKLDWVQATEEQMSCKCPECGETVYKRGNQVLCHGCGFNLWASITGKELNDDEIGYILEHGRSSKKISGFKSKAGKTFSAHLLLNKNGKDSKLTFKFD